MSAKKLEFILHSEKKHSVRYQNEQYGMTVYVSNDVLEEVTSFKPLSLAPNKILITIELP